MIDNYGLKSGREYESRNAYFPNKIQVIKKNSPRGLEAKLLKNEKSEIFLNSHASIENKRKLRFLTYLKVRKV
jgi:hypothetical protein